MTSQTTLQDEYYTHAPPALVDELAQFRAQHHPQSVTIGEHRWQVITAGDTSAPAVLLLHGSGGTAETMFRYIQTLADDFFVIAPDLPATVRDLDTATAGLYAVLQAHQRESVHVVGIGFGALLAQMFVRRFLSQVRHLVITHTTIPSQHLAEQAAAQRWLLRWYPSALVMWLARRAYRNDLADSVTPADDGERAFWQAYFEELYTTHLSKADLLARAYLAADYHHGKEFSAKDLREQRGALLIIESAHDHIINEGDRGALKGMYPGAYIQTLPMGDHLAPVLASRALSRSIYKFLTQGD